LPKLEIVILNTGFDCNTGSEYVEFTVELTDKTDKLTVDDIVVSCENSESITPPTEVTPGTKWEYRVYMNVTEPTDFFITAAFKNSECPHYVEKVSLSPSETILFRTEYQACRETTSVMFFFTTGKPPFKIEFNGQTYADLTSVNTVTVPNVNAGKHQAKVIDANGCPYPIEFFIRGPLNNEAIKALMTVQDATCDGVANGSVTFNFETEYMISWEDIGKAPERHGPPEYKREEMAAGIYRLLLFYYDEFDIDTCMDSPYELEISNNNTFDISITGNGGGEHHNLYCPGNDVALSGDITITIDGIEVSDNMSLNDFIATWTYDDNHVDFDPNQLLELTARGQTVSLTASFMPTTEITCTQTETFDIAALELPVIEFEDDVMYIPEGMQEELKVNISNWDGHDWKWSSEPEGFTDGLDDPSFPPIMIPSPDRGDYTLTLTLTEGLNGCSDSASIDIAFALDIFIPNIITPNGVEPNNEWKFRNLEQYAGKYDIEVQIFSRAGLLVYSRKSYSNTPGVAWDGRRNGQDLPIATYYYVVQITQISTNKILGKPITGTVTIIR